jgi:hypothetical protein
MVSAKDIIIKPITAQAANALVKRVHYSGTHTQNSQLHFGAFYKGKLEGAMQFGPPIDRRKVLPLVADTEWNNMIELNRMAFSDRLPRNSESRALSVAFRLIKKHYPHIEWVISFADGAQCGDGAIYRASGFVLTGIKKNVQMLRMPDGSVIAKKTLDNPQHMAAGGKFGSAAAREAGAKPLPGYQLRYIYFLNKEARKRLTVPILPFSKIDEMGAGMYKGESIKRDTKATTNDQLVGGGAIPTITLHSSCAASKKTHEA